ncbi:MAG: 8-oxoguanine DNA glycosylase [Eubacterium sp.]|nr:8-oxoguanine DNA glycosylase [Eubacterium sp.]
MLKINVDNFSLDQILRSGQCFRMEKLSENEYEEVYEIIAGNRYLKAGQMENTLCLYCEEDEYEFWLQYFDLNHDYRIYIDQINPRDTYLLEAARCACGVRILRQDLWEMIVTFLVSQQNHIRRIRRCIALLCEKYGEFIPFSDTLTDQEKLSADMPDHQEGISPSDAGNQKKGYYTFPAPEVFAGLPEDALMECSLGYRSKYVVRSAKQIVSGEVNLDRIMNLPYKEAKQELLRLFGVGEKVADCICLFSRHDLDAFPVDTHIRQALDAHYKRGFPNRRYKGFRGVIQQYIFCYELWG